MAHRLLDILAAVLTWGHLIGSTLFVALLGGVTAWQLASGQLTVEESIPLLAALAFAIAASVVALILHIRRARTEKAAFKAQVREYLDAEDQRAH